MKTPQEHELRLQIPGVPELKSMSNAFIEQALAFADFEGELATKLRDSASEILSIIESKIENDGDIALLINLRVVIDPLMFRLEILEHGQIMSNKDLKNTSSAFEEMRWKQLGTKGSQLSLTHKRPHEEISTLVHVEERLSEKEMHEEEIQPSKTGNESYRIRTFIESDALEVSKLIFESYGRTYANEDLYYPERIAKANNIGKLSSAVAESSDGQIVGHLALEMPSPHPIAELGIAVVNHAHRGHGILNLMNEFLLNTARNLGLEAQWAQPVTAHPYSQRMNLAYGWNPCGVSFGAIPCSLQFRGGATKEGSNRSTLLMHVLHLMPRPSTTASVPKELQDIVRSIYEAQGCNAKIITTLTPPPTDLPNTNNECTVHSTFSRLMQAGTIQVHSIDDKTLPFIQIAEENLREVSGAEVIYLDLPITNMNCAWLADALAHQGFVFCGICPRFLGEDSLRLQKPIAPYAHENLAIEGELAQRIVGEVLQALRA